MKRISIIKNNQITNQASFANDELLNEWLNRETLNLSFGYPERNLIDNPLNPVSEELKAIAISTEQVEIGGIAFTSYKIPAEFTYEIEDITAEVEAEDRRNSLIAQGEKTAKACKDAFNLISGYNQYRTLTSAQKDQMTATFAPIVQALKIHERPSLAKSMIVAIEPDGVLVTEQMKADMLEVLKEF